MNCKLWIIYFIVHSHTIRSHSGACSCPYGCWGCDFTRDTRVLFIVVCPKCKRMLLLSFSFASKSHSVNIPKRLRTTIFTRLYSLMIPLSNALRAYFLVNLVLDWCSAFQAANMQYTHLGSLSDMCETRAVFSYAYINCSDLIYVMIHAFLYISSFFFHTLLCI